jgi:hypothetical protein
MKRRKFILAIVAVGAAAIAVPWGFKRYENLRWKSQPLIHPEVLSQFCDEEAIRKIGLVYRASVPAENSKEQLTKLILSEVKTSDPGYSGNSLNENQLKIQGEKDFRDERLVILNGWVLSQTEARQCALLSFT